MNDFGQINFGHARRAHLALVEGGASISTNATGSARAVAPTPPRAAATGFAAASIEAPRSRHESGVRAVARTYDNFDDALLPMVLASGVSGEAATSVAEAIKGNPALKAQAERAFNRARLDVV